MMLLIQPQHIKYLLCTILLAYNTDALASISATLRMDRCVLVY